MDRKQIFLLIGQKGSGKSFIGTIFERAFSIEFVRVEDWAKQIKRDREVDSETYLKDVFETIEYGIRQRLNQTDKIVFESTGLSEYFDRILAHLKRDFYVTTIGVRAGYQTCLVRVRQRDASIHINVSDEEVAMINKKVRQREFTTDFQIDNDSKTESELIEVFGYHKTNRMLIVENLLQPLLWGHRYSEIFGTSQIT